MSRPSSNTPCTGRLLISGVLLATTLWAGCGVFAPREPKSPDTSGEKNTFTPANQPEQVITNLQAAVANMSTQTYRRSLTDDLTFMPTASAEAAAPVLWTNWGKAEEVRYFNTLSAAARPAAQHELVLTGGTLTPLREDRYAYDADYQLTVRHSRLDEVPTTVEGHLRWEFVQGDDGLWRLQSWTDQRTGNTPSWSTLKAAFVQ